MKKRSVSKGMSRTIPLRILHCEDTAQRIPYFFFVEAVRGHQSSKVCLASCYVIDMPIIYRALIPHLSMRKGVLHLSSFFFAVLTNLAS